MSRSVSSLMKASPPPSTVGFVAGYGLHSQRSFFHCLCARVASGAAPLNAPRRARRVDTSGAFPLHFAPAERGHVAVRGGLASCRTRCARSAAVASPIA